MTFSVGDTAVYPAHGVGRIKGVENKEIAGRKLSFYILELLDSGMTIMVPTNNARALRKVIGKEEIEEVYVILRQRDVQQEHTTWNRRYREYMGKIKTGSLHEIATVLRDLSLLKSDKTLSFGERKMLDTARSLLVKELSIARGLEEDAIESELQDIFESEEMAQA